MKECNLCGAVLTLDAFHRQVKGRFGRKAKCKACTSAAYYEPNKAKVMERTRLRRSTEHGRAREREWQRARRQSNRLVRLVQEAKVRAAARGIPFDLKASDLAIPELCPVIGIPIDLAAGTRADGSPSLDRMDGSLGYVRSNTRVISWRANRLKSDATLAELEAIVVYMRAALGVAVIALAQGDAG